MNHPFNRRYLCKTLFALAIALPGCLDDAENAGVLQPQPDSSPASVVQQTASAAQSTLTANWPSTGHLDVPSDLSPTPQAPTSGTSSANTPPANNPPGENPPANDPPTNNPNVEFPAGWLFTRANKILISDGLGGGVPFRGRGANLQDTRGCGACLYEPFNAGEVKRRAGELIDVWGANFVRLTLESRPIPDNQFARPAPGVLDDPAYLADIVDIVSDMTARPGVYVLVSLWIEPTVNAFEWPTPATDAVWRKLAETFAHQPKVMFGITNEPTENFDGDLDAACWDAMNQAAGAIREVENTAGVPQHVILAQGTRWWGRKLDYYVSHPLTAGGGANFAYETHVYNPSDYFQALFAGPAAQIPVVIGEFGPIEGGPEDSMTMNDCAELMTLARALDVPHLAWTFHQNCPPNLIEDHANGLCGIGMELIPTAWGRLLKQNLAVAW